MTKIILVEDEKSIRESLSQYLTQEGFQIFTAQNLSEARKLDLNQADLMILDWMLPDGQGVDYLRELRKSHTLPVILLTAKTDLVDKILGLETGANDYITKPFEPRELITRIRVQLRQTPVTTSHFITGGGITMDLKQHQVKYKNKIVVLTKMEFDLLKLFLENPHKVFSRDELLNKVWGFDNYPTTRTVDTHILQLRQKICDDIFETLRGVGYRFVP